MRTQEQIIEDCEARFDELRAEKKRRDNDPQLNFPCNACKWAKGDGFHGELKSFHCHEPLVMGFGKPPLVYGFDADHKERVVDVCGPEKALWQPKPTIFESIINMVFGG